MSALCHQRTLATRSRRYELTARVTTLPVRYQAGTAGPILTKTSERLFTGISTSSSSSSPWGAASPTRSSTSRTPQRGSRLFRSASKAALDADVCIPPSMKGPYKTRTPSGLKSAPHRQGARALPPKARCGPYSRRSSRQMVRRPPRPIPLRARRWRPALAHWRALRWHFTP
jgi:hypothetical protein